MKTRKEIEACVDAETLIEELSAALRLMLRAYESVLPGIKHIAVQDYALINDAPVAAEKALRKATTRQ